MNVTVRKTGGAVVGTLIRGDNGTTGLKLVIPRRDGGADLAELAWSVQIRNADGASDVYVPKEVHAGEREITFDWTPGSVATSAEGMTEFMVQGVRDADDPPVWQSARYYLQIADSLNADPHEGLTELQQLIVYVQLELPDVLTARDEAREAAKEAGAAAGRADAATETAGTAAGRADTAAETAGAAAGRADAAAETAGAAAGRADAATEAANTAAGHADAATEAASAAAGRADAATEAASAAAGRADAAAETASAAAGRADAAAAAASAAAGRADTAAETAGAAAGRADAAAESADGSAALAHVAASRAEDAVAAIADAAPVIVCGAEGELIVLDDASDRPLKGMNVYGRTTRDGTPSPDNPVEMVSVGGAGSIGVRVCGKNLLKVDFSEFENKGVTFTPADDGGVRVSGTTQNYPYHTIGKIYIQTGKTYRLKLFGEIPENLKCRIIDRSESEPYTHISNVTSNSIFVAKKSGLSNVEITVNPGYDAETTIYPQISIGNADVEYEAYTGIEMSIATPDGLPGIPVDSGGNYTDGNGQQWVCDEIDLARGVYVKRVEQAVLDGNAKLSTQEAAASENTILFNFANMFNGYSALENRFCITDKFQSFYGWNPQNYKWGIGDVENIGFNPDASYCRFLYLRISRSRLATQDAAGAQAWLADNPINIIYQLLDPAEIPLTDGEIAAYRALHTNKSDTTILNDADAHMSVEYAADTKIYIDNKIAGLAAAILGNA